MEESGNEDEQRTRFLCSMDLSRIRDEPHEHDSLTFAIIGCAIEVHKAIGPGLKESVYENCLRREFAKRSFVYRCQPSVTVSYDGQTVGRSFRPDFIVGEAVVVELKAASAISPIHQSQVLSYMRASKLELGLIINLNVEILVRGVKRLILTKSE